MNVLSTFTSECTKCAQSPQRPKEGIRFSGTGITDRCEPAGGCWELNLGPLEKQPVLLTAEPSLQP